MSENLKLTQYPKPSSPDQVPSPSFSVIALIAQNPRNHSLCRRTLQIFPVFDKELGERFGGPEPAGGQRQFGDRAPVRWPLPTASSR